MKRLSMISLGLGVLLVGPINAHAESELWDDMMLTAYGEPQQDEAQQQQEQQQQQGAAQQDDKGGQAAAQDDKGGQGQAQADKGDQGQAQADKGDQGQAQADKGDQGQAQEEQQQQQEQQGQQEQVGKPGQRVGKYLFGHHDGDGPSLNPNLQPLSYFLGFWNCTANVTDPNGNNVTINKSAYFKPAFGGNWVAAVWGKGQCSGDDGDGSSGGSSDPNAGTGPSNGALMGHHHHHHHIAGAGTEGYNPFTKQFVKMGVTRWGGYGYATSDGWDSSNTLVWTGEAWNVHGQAHLYKQISISQTDKDNFSVSVAVGTDGSTYNHVGTATCARGTHPDHDHHGR